MVEYTIFIQNGTCPEYNAHGKTFIIKSREVTDWIICNEEKNTKDNKILFFKKSY